MELQKERIVSLIKETVEELKRREQKLTSEDRVLIMTMASVSISSAIALATCAAIRKLKNRVRKCEKRIKEIEDVQAVG